jgi:hypothetical protein
MWTELASDTSRRAAFDRIARQMDNYVTLRVPRISWCLFLPHKIVVRIVARAWIVIVANTCAQTDNTAVIVTLLRMAASIFDNAERQFGRGLTSTTAALTAFLVSHGTTYIRDPAITDDGDLLRLFRNAVAHNCFQIGGRDTTFWNIGSSADADNSAAAKATTWCWWVPTVVLISALRACIETWLKQGIIFDPFLSTVKTLLSLKTTDDAFDGKIVVKVNTPLDRYLE